MFAGDACIAQFSEDKCWYRSEVLMVIPDGANTKVGVIFADYGTAEIVTMDRYLNISL